MKKLDIDSYKEIRQWIYRNARPIELALWQYKFEHGSMETVLSALSFYQNEDGGFGNALEPDSWNPNSSPYTTLNAIGKLKDMNITDKKNPILQGIFKFLESGRHCTDSGWLFSIPSNNNYPHAPWWTYDSEANEYESIGISAGIACFILKFADKESPIYQFAYSVVEKLIAKLSMPGKYGEMGVAGYCELMELMFQLGLTNRFDMDYISSTVKRLVHDSIELDVSKWAYHGKTPSSFITSPNNLLYKDNEQIMQQELDYIVETRPQNGVWGITWSWFDNNDKYPKEFSISENWWKADTAISKLKLLRNFGRLEYDTLNM